MSRLPDMQELNAFVDGELDLLRQVELEARLAEDAALRAQVEALRQLRSSIHDRAEYHAAPAALRARVRRITATAASERTAGAAAPAPRRPGWRPLPAALAVTAAAVAVGLGFGLAQLRDGSDVRIERDVVASHVRATLSERQVDVASSDSHTVKPWLSARLDFSPPVAALNLPGSVFLGGRADYADGRPVAVLVYRQGQHAVDDYVWPTDGADSAPAFASSRGFHLAHWSHQGMSHWVISDISPAEFAKVVAALRQAGDGP